MNKHKDKNNKYAQDTSFSFIISHFCKSTFLYIYMVG